MIRRFKPLDSVLLSTDDTMSTLLGGNSRGCDRMKLIPVIIKVPSQEFTTIKINGIGGLCVLVLHFFYNSPFSLTLS